MNDEVRELVDSHRRRALSRRQLAAGLSAATLGWAGAAGAARARTASDPLPVTNADHVPAAAGGGADDYQALQDAIDAAAAAGGGRVVVTEPLLTGSTLLLKTGVELVGTGRIGSAIGAHPTFTGAPLIQVEADSHHAGLLGLTVDGAGLCARALVELGAGCSRFWATGVRFTGWSLAHPAVSGIRLTEPADPSGSDTPIRGVVIERCEFDELGNGVTISGGAGEISILDSRFTGMHRRAVWLYGGGEHSSRNVQIVGNTIVDFPEDDAMGNPISLGDVADLFHEQIHVARNVVVGNGDFHGPGGFGTADHYTVHCVRNSLLHGNFSVDSGESGFTLTDSSQVLCSGNFAIGSDIAGFVVKAKDGRCQSLGFVGNYAQNNGRNRGSAGGSIEVYSGFVLRDFGLGIYDTQLTGNHAWDDQKTRTQSYALVVEHGTIFKTYLVANRWRTSQHVLGTVLNRGRGTFEAQFTRLERET